MTKRIFSLPWYKWFNSTKTRILIWYFLLTTFSSVVSILLTYHVLYERTRDQSEAYVSQQLRDFREIVSGHTQVTEQSIEKSVAAAFDKFLSGYTSGDSDDYAIGFLDGRVYGYTSLFPTTLLTQDPQLLEQWGKLSESRRGEISTSVGNLFYIAEPVQVNGKNRGVLIIIHCADTDYQLVNGAVLLIIQGTLVVFMIAVAIAWATARHVLYPLKALTQTAQSITESDMTRRVPVERSDEIAMLATTFNAMLDRLQATFENQQEFLKDAGHELRTPITVIRGYLETLKYRPERQEQIIALALDELDRMGRLVNDLLLLAKAKRPDFLMLQWEELDWLTEELYLKVCSLANRDWRLESKGLSPVVVDRQRLTQAVMNLVQNAVRHTRDGDVITIGSSVKEGFAYIWVSDTGEGIATEDQKRIFERFTRLSTCDPLFEGHGLGLSIVQAIVQSHVGRIELSSRLGHGSIFTIVIPLIPSQDIDDEQNSYRRRQSTYY